MYSEQSYQIRNPFWTLNLHSHITDMAYVCLLYVLFMSLRRHDNCKTDRVLVAVTL